VAYNQEKINRDLATRDSSGSEFQKKVVQYCEQCLKISANQMSDYYDQWDNNEFIYRGYRGLDKDDKESIKEGNPPKIIVPITYAQAQTALSFAFSTFTQKSTLFELLGSGPEDQRYSLALETDLDYQMRNQKSLFKIYCYLLDHFKYGFGVMKIDWTEDYTQMRTAVQKPVFDILGSIKGLFGGDVQQKFNTVEEIQDVLAYQGNRLANVSPYSFFPDPSVTLSNFQDGKFVGHDQETSRSQVESEEGDEFFGTDKIPESIANEDMRDRKRRTGSIFKDQSNGLVGAAAGKNAPSVVVKTEVEFRMSEAEASKQFDYDCGSGKKIITWIAVIGNDRKLIKFQPSGYLHGTFNYVLSEYSPDHNAFYNPGLADTIYELQNLITFFLNSHVVNVKKIIQNRFIGDESKVYMEDLKSNAAFIRLKQSGLPIDRILQQLQVSDITKNHVNDLDVLVKMIQVVTGINENALGQYSGGRRSATEARSVNAGAAARLKMFCQLVWLQGLEPMGKQCLANTRQGRTKEVYARIVGEQILKAPYEKVILADPMSLAGGYDFAAYDATLPSDRQQQAMVFTQLFETMMSNPQSMQILNKSPIKLLEHIAELYNIKNFDDYNLNPETPLRNPEMEIQQDQQVMEGVQSGALQPTATPDSLIKSLAAA